ncbi:unnamed protein product [Oppiella nova]|uniref:ABC transmembrane type-1 domain-containing protein n=1 Tax=Oppiella nova TaxID=334625 RepID=A0A7R9MDL5_9ACAR|nr:unnamed protein product [Oppiella nova]CAG2175260.1 unnamed protein product [Oppiella nova]
MHGRRWIFPVFMTGWRNNGLNVDDLFRCSRHDESQPIVQELQKHWNNERQKKSSKFWRALVMAFGKYYIPPLTLLILGECVCRICQPLLLGIVIDHFNKVENRTFKQACMAAGGTPCAHTYFCSSWTIGCDSSCREHWKRSSTLRPLFRKPVINTGNIHLFV